MRGDLVEIWREIKSRPRKARYVYLLSHPDGQPFYVGVGTWRRILVHERPPHLNAPNTKARTIRQIIDAGGSVKYAIAGWFEQWLEAAEEERRLITLHGREDLGLGSLKNRTNGGQGTAGIKWHASTKRADAAKRAGEKQRGRKHTEEHRARIAAGTSGHIVSPETIDKMSKALKGRRLSAEHREKLSRAKQGRKPSEQLLAAGARWRAENAQMISDKRKIIWSDPAYREKMSTAFRAAKRKALLAAD